MARRRPLLALAVMAVLIVVLVVAALAGARAPTEAARASPTTTLTTMTTVLDNDFIPEDANLSDCISGVPRPGCGSDAKGGWRQGLVFLVIVAAMALVGWRLVRGVRAGRSAP